MTLLLRATPEYLQQCRDAQAREQAASLTATNQWAHVDKAQAHQDFQRLYGDLAPLIDHSEPSSPAVQQLIAQHYTIAARFYPASRQAYVGTALFYAENAAMKAFHDAYHPRLVEFLGEAMFVYAHSEL
ncbi:TipAS antibiotic-recognition domain-containing protein [Cystobacter fuscus]|uniref:TipAS antibiotic-recognition domain-containing protein n=1 Tax=Cystobacter fuscus TaxID=43 RepID=UPI002B2A15A9|nr:transcriptional regulator [Cystobacter fuscus]